MIENLTARELTEVEKLAGVSIMSMDDPKSPKMPLLVAMAYVLKRKEDPKVKLASVQDMSLSEIMAIVSPEDADDDTKSAA